MRMCPAEKKLSSSEPKAWAKEKPRTVVEQCGPFGGAESRNRTGTVFCTGRF